MKWFYAKRGNVREHGVVDDEALHKMAADGKLSRDDLLWNESSNTGWIRASSVTDRFSEKQPRIDPALPAAVGQTPAAPASRQAVQKKKAAKAEKKRRNLLRPILLLTCLVAVAVIARQQLLDEAREKIESLCGKPSVPVEEPVPEAVEQTNVWDDVIPRIEESLKNGNAEAAELLLAKIESVPDMKKVADSLSVRIAELKSSQKKLAALKNALMNGTLDRRGANQLVALSTRYGEVASLPAMLKLILSQKSNLNAGKCMSVLKTARVLENKELVSESVAGVADRIDDIDWPFCYEVVQACSEAGFSDQAVELVEKFIAKEPKSGPAWLEMAALQCVNGQGKDALKSLKKAVKYGDEDIKKKARGDKRFDPIRDTRAFARYTR